MSTPQTAFVSAMVIAPLNSQVEFIAQMNSRRVVR
jgi:hypothetical protein